ncbi:MAG: hypothetical protein Q8P31_02400 [Bacillota bacterium]|nr:hypothetical protein [Bacillota bacterium]
MLPAALDMDLNAESLRERIVQLGGTAWLFEAARPVGGAHGQLVSLYESARAEEYAPLLEGLTRIMRHVEKAADHWDISASELDVLRAELSKLRAQSRQIRARDHFGSAAGRRIDALLDSCAERLAGREDTVSTTPRLKPGACT